MRNIRTQGDLDPAVRRDVARLREVMTALGRLRSLRDPLFAHVEAQRLTPPQIHALMWSGQDGPITMGALAKRLGVSEKTMTGVVDRLERGGYLERERDAADRRVVRVRLTRKGAGLHRRIDRSLDDKLGCVLALLEPKDRRALVEILDKLLKVVSLAGERAQEGQS